jgi:hypothetical protein
MNVVPCISLALCCKHAEANVHIRAASFLSQVRCLYWCWEFTFLSLIQHTVHVSHTDASVLKVCTQTEGWILYQINIYGWYIL